MYSSPWFDFVICLFFGFLGVHRFRIRQYGMGILYLLTGGLFGIGWFVDFIRYLIAALEDRKIWGNLPVAQVTINATLTGQPGMPVAGSYAPRPTVIPSGRTLYPNEPLPVVPCNLLLRDGDVCRYCGHAIFSYGNQNNEGLLSITDQRIVFSCDQGAFDHQIDMLSAVNPHVDAISFQFGSKHYTLFTSDANYLSQLLLRIINQ